MKFPARNHHIALSDASRLTRRHREGRPGAESGGAFHAPQVQELLDQPGVAALRYYHALAEDGRPSVVLVAADAQCNDLWRGVLLGQCIPCPPYGSVANELNVSERPRGKRPYRTSPMALPDRDHHVAAEEAAVMTRRFRERFPEREKAGAFLADQVREVLAHRDCRAIRYYYAVEDVPRDTLVLVGVDPEGADLTDGVLLELTIPCPPWCSDLNVLNWSGRVIQRRLEVAALAGAR